MSKRILHALFYSIVKLNSIPVNVTSCFSHVFTGVCSNMGLYTTV